MTCRNCFAAEISLALLVALDKSAFFFAKGWSLVVAFLRDLDLQDPTIGYSNKMKKRRLDPIVAEVRAVRDEHAARFGYDVKAIFTDIQARQKASSRTFGYEI